MIKIKHYLEQLKQQLVEIFGDRLLYLGLQGSYMRGEATEDSDIDIMVVLDELGAKDLAAYRDVIKNMEAADKSCGFICSKEDLSNWNACEICQLMYGTEDYYGRLADLVPVYTKEDIRQYIKIMTGNLYHEICHRYIHAPLEKNYARLKISYKQVFYILQHVQYLRTGKYINSKSELLKQLSGEDYNVLKIAMEQKEVDSETFPEKYQQLLRWCQQTLQSEIVQRQIL